MLSILASGTLACTPQRRNGHGDRAYAYALMRVPAEGSDALLISISAFGDAAVAALLSLRKGDALAVTGRGKLEVWDKESEQRHGLNVVVERILSLSATNHELNAASIGHAGATATHCPSLT